jgi:2-oxoglutarate ferredoxin oxidoreductase subunit alpha
VGVSARAAARAVRVARARGVRAGLFRPRTLWPFPDRELRAAAEGARAVVVAEMNMGQMAHEVERVVAGQAPVRRCLRADGQPRAPGDVLAALGVAEEAGVPR